MREQPARAKGGSRSALPAIVIPVKLVSRFGLQEEYRILYSHGFANNIQHFQMIPVFL